MLSFSIPPQYVRRKRYVVPPSLNARLHWAARKKITDAFKETVAWTIKSLRHLKMKRAKITIVISRAGKLQDQDNAYSSTKSILDGIVLSGIIPDDSPKYVDLDVSQRLVPHRKDEQILIQIIEMR